MDLRGDLILTHNPVMVRTRNKSAAPAYVKNARHIDAIHAQGFIFKVKATIAAARFIWGKNTALTRKAVDQELVL
ncbi:MAG: hypothetical protein GY820_25805 [Gammaproteobacteria bacterium]|nr:hypothetical protein [Gammaproteobacteria bacterium]